MVRLVLIAREHDRVLREVGCDYAQGFRCTQAEAAAAVHRRWLEHAG
jgi:EAL domain-containing protein (putative c-di-GMP-specific phosphodiesterase class I)